MEYRQTKPKGTTMARTTKAQMNAALASLRYETDRLGITDPNGYPFYVKVGNSSYNYIWEVYTSEDGKNPSKRIAHAYGSRTAFYNAIHVVALALRLVNP